MLTRPDGSCDCTFEVGVNTVCISIEVRTPYAGGTQFSSAACWGLFSATACSAVSPRSHLSLVSRKRFCSSARLRVSPSVLVAKFSDFARRFDGFAPSITGLTLVQLCELKIPPLNRSSNNLLYSSRSSPTTPPVQNMFSKMMTGKIYDQQDDDRRISAKQ
ncbi:hypothetical protein GQX74_005009 [Glossina fuscipes]|nr:hypothetical protein GQX74_005009 [Glossina fuscipes]